MNSVAWGWRYTGIMSETTDHPYIVSDPNGEPIIQETRVPVRGVVELWRIGVRPEEIPDHLPQIGFAQVFDALSYYANHREQVDGFIDINRVEDHEIHPSVHGK